MATANSRRNCQCQFVLAGDPNAAKTIMAGLLLCERMMRADAKRVLVVAPGSLTEQWQDELTEKFGLRFELFSREKQAQCHSRNYFGEQDQLIARLDQFSRNEELEKLWPRPSGISSSSTKPTGCRPAITTRRSTVPADFNWTSYVAGWPATSC